MPDFESEQELREFFQRAKSTAKTFTPEEVRELELRLFESGREAIEAYERASAHAKRRAHQVWVRKCAS